MTRGSQRERLGTRQSTKTEAHENRAEVQISKQKLESKTTGNWDGLTPEHQPRAEPFSEEWRLE